MVLVLRRAMALLTVLLREYRMVPANAGGLLLLLLRRMGVQGVRIWIHGSTIVPVLRHRAGSHWDTLDTRQRVRGRRLVHDCQ